METIPIQSSAPTVDGSENHVRYSKRIVLIRLISPDTREGPKAYPMEAKSNRGRHSLRNVHILLEELLGSFAESKVPNSEKESLSPAQQITNEEVSPDKLLPVAASNIASPSCNTSTPAVARRTDWRTDRIVYCVNFALSTIMSRIGTAITASAAKKATWVESDSMRIFVTSGFKQDCHLHIQRQKFVAPERCMQNPTSEPRRVPKTILSPFGGEFFCDHRRICCGTTLLGHETQSRQR